MAEGKNKGGRPTSRAGVRTEVVAARFTPAEAAEIDAARGALSRSEWFRWLALRTVRGK